MANQWHLGSQSTYKSAPKYSIGTGTEIVKKKNVPGPGHYSQTDADKDKFKRSASWAISSAGREGGKWFQPPGPGAYTPGDPRDAPKWVIGSEKRLHELPKPKVPGPGTYENRPNNDQHHFSICHKPDAPTPHKTPGPTEYKPNHEHNSLIRSAPRIGFGSATRGELVSSKTPGPGSYEALSGLTGNYVMRTPAKYSIAGKYKDLPKMKSPGILHSSCGTQFK